MCSRHRSCKRTHAHDGGFTLVELMIGVAIGLFATLAVTQVLLNSESQKRAATSGSDAQVNGALALDLLKRAVESAGYGFGANPQAIGCAITANWNGAAVANFPTSLVPVTITNGPSGAPDAIRVLASGKLSASLPIRIVPPGYTVGGTTFSVSSTISVDGPQPAAAPTVPGELLAAVKAGGGTCEVFQATSAPPSTTQINRADGGWNSANFPTLVYGDGDYLLNLATPVDMTFSVVGDSLRLNTFRMAADGTPSYSGASEVFSGIVSIQAEYGKDTDGDGVVDTWDTVTPTTNAGWVQLIAVRMAVVARSASYAKDKVTFACPTWNGNAVTIPGSSTCTPSAATDESWMHYRYKVFDTVVPLRNLIWNS